MIRVLIVEDHAIVRRGLREVLADGFPELQVGEAESAAAAMQLLRTQPWSIVLLDINIPGRDGLELLADLKRLFPDLPALVLSQYPEEEFAIRSFKLGAAGYLTKSRAPDDLLAAVRKALAGGKYVTPQLAERLASAVGGDLIPVPHESLSIRELQVLRGVALGSTLKEIASDLALSEKTVGTYRARIAKKMGLSTNVDIARYALQHQLVP